MKTGALLSGLTVRIIGLIVIAAAVAAAVVSRHYEKVLEQAMLDAVEKQALVYLFGLAHEVNQLPDPLAAGALQEVIAHKASQSDEPLDFAIFQLYAFDRNGAVLAHSGGLPQPSKTMDGYLDPVMERGQPYLADEIEYFRDPVSGKSRPKADIILPLELAGGARIALEVEVLLDETMAKISSMDDAYEKQLWAWIIGVTLLLSGFIGLVVHQGLIAPVNRIQRATARIAAGELETRVEGAASGNELGRLSLSVNRMAESLERLIAEQEEAYLQMMQSLAKALEAKDAYTASHSARVARFAVRLARRIGYSEQRLEVLKRGALMHDLGKIGIADAILNKPSALSDEEYEIMQRHPVYTAAIMRPLKRLEEHAAIAAWHHERWDGAGYPDGLAGEAIPLSARIVAIADTWDAMTGDRVYRKGMPPEKALGILQQERDRGQFDPTLLDEFAAMIHEELEARRMVSEDREKSA